jgi:penicillin-binding protein 2
LRKSIVVSCNTYYYILGRDMGIDRISTFMKPFGFGQPTGIDLENEKAGVLPSQEWKRNRYLKNPQAGKWVGGDTISVSNGSGYNSYTILQIAQATSILANNGVIMKPHLVKIIEDAATRQRRLTVPKESGRIPLKQENIDLVKDGMVGVTSEPGGTAFRAFQNNTAYRVGGKTGTAQVIGMKANEKYNAANLAERLRDNALFVAFAPADKPKIVLAMVVENAGFGGAVAAPIARKVLDYHLLGKRPTEKETTKVPKEDAMELVPVDDPALEAAAAEAKEKLTAPGAAPAKAPAPSPGAAAKPPAAPPPRKRE